MKLRTTAAVALLASTLALGGCGDQEDPKAESIGYGTYVPKSESLRPQAPPGYDRHRSVDGGFVFPYGTVPSGSGRTPDHGTHDRARTAE